MTDMTARRWAATLCIGGTLAAALALVSMVLGGSPTRGDAAFLAVCALPAGAGLGWLLVRREPVNAELNVENDWHLRANAGAWRDLLSALSVLLVATAVTGAEFDVDALLAMTTVISVATIDSAIRYLRLERQES